VGPRGGELSFETVHPDDEQSNDVYQIFVIWTGFKGNQRGTREDREANKAAEKTTTSKSFHHPSPFY
jgi:hypothetical protein